MSQGKRICATVTPQILESIEQLLWSGLYGSSRSEVIARLLSEAIEGKVASGLIERAWLPRRNSLRDVVDSIDVEQSP